ncbi:MAG: hypothetical protein QM669_14510 [Siphonobacter sp.]
MHRSIKPFSGQRFRVEVKAGDVLTAEVQVQKQSLERKRLLGALTGVALSSIGTEKLSESTKGKSVRYGLGLAVVPSFFTNGQSKASLELYIYDQQGVLQSSARSIKTLKKSSELLTTSGNVHKDGYVEISVANNSKTGIIFSGLHLQRLVGKIKKETNPDEGEKATMAAEEECWTWWADCGCYTACATTFADAVVVKAPAPNNNSGNSSDDSGSSNSSGNNASGGGSGSTGGGGGSAATGGQSPGIIAKTKYCDIYSKLWNGQASSNVETAAWMTSKGYIPLPTCGTNQNTKQYQCNTHFTAYFDYFPTRASGNGYEVYYNGEWLKILGAIHTHPTDGASDPSSLDYAFANYWGVPLYGITKSGLWSVDKRYGRRDFANYNPATNCWGAIDPYSYL